MKTLVNYFIIMILWVLPISLMSQSTVEGYVTYDNPASTPLPNVTVTLQTGGGSAVTNSSGYYQITGVPDGTYSCQVSSVMPYGFANSVDALFIMRNFVQIPPLLTGLRLATADVNCNGPVANAADALSVLKRWVGLIPNFMPPYVGPPGGPDWRFTSPNVVVDFSTSSVYTLNLKGLSAGDVIPDAY